MMKLRMEVIWRLGLYIHINRAPYRTLVEKIENMSIVFKNISNPSFFVNSTHYIAINIFSL